MNIFTGDLPAFLLSVSSDDSEGLIEFAALDLSIEQAVKLREVCHDAEMLEKKYDVGVKITLPYITPVWIDSFVFGEPSERIDDETEELNDLKGAVLEIGSLRLSPKETRAFYVHNEWISKVYNPQATCSRDQVYWTAWYEGSFLTTGAISVKQLERIGK